MEQNQTSIKVLSVGDTQVGKSCLIKRYCEGRFVQRYITTIGVDYGVKKMTIKNRKVAINFFDLSGDKDYETIRNDFYKNAQGVLLVFDLDNRDSFLNVAKWEKDMRDYGIDKKALITLVGNKCDLKSRQLEQSEIMKFAKSKGWEYVQTSASSGENVVEVFEKLFTKIIDVIDENKAQLKLK